MPNSRIALNSGSLFSVRESAAGTGRLALALEAALTAVARIRSGRQVIDDVSAFRAQLVRALDQAATDGRTNGYSAEDVRLAEYAAVALLDESMLRQPSLSVAWARRPLQDERYGQHLAGDRFYQNVEELLTRPDSDALADVLELYQLCLQLGFRGRHGSDLTALQLISHRIIQRVARLHGRLGDIAPEWRPPNDAVARADPWARPLTTGLVACAALVVAIWCAGALSLRVATDSVRRLAPTMSGTTQ